MLLYLNPCKNVIAFSLFLQQQVNNTFFLIYSRLLETKMKFFSERFIKSD